jgi:hypothetical protein
MRKTKTEAVSGIFSTEQDLESFLMMLEGQGYSEDSIRVVMSEETQDNYLALKGRTKTPQGALIGGMLGGLIGALAGGILMTGTVIDGPSDYLIPGPLIGALAGGALGTYGGTFLGAFIGFGIPEHHARFQKSALKEPGAARVIVRVPSEKRQEIRTLFRKHKAQHLES